MADRSVYLKRIILLAGLSVGLACGVSRAFGEVPQAVGQARAPERMGGAQARLMAERGAQVVAARNLMAGAAAQPGIARPSSARITTRGVVAGHVHGPTRQGGDGVTLSTIRLKPGGFLASRSTVAGHQRVHHYPPR